MSASISTFHSSPQEIQIQKVWVDAWKSAFNKRSRRFWFAAGLRASKIGVLWVILMVLKSLPTPAASSMLSPPPNLGLVFDFQYSQGHFFPKC